MRIDPSKFEPIEPGEWPKPMTHTSGVYSILNIDTGEEYVGCSTWIEQRWQQHRYALRAGRHISKSMQTAWDQYGEYAFDFTVVEAVGRVSVLRDFRNSAVLRDLKELEVRYIAERKPAYNTKQPRTAA